MRQLTLTNVQFEVLHDIVKDAIDELKCDLVANGLLDEQTLYTTETYKIYAQLNNLQDLNPIPTVLINEDDYGDKVDTLVSNMVASNDNEFTHDSEGC